MEKAVRIMKFGACPVSCFELGGREVRRGVVSGVPLTMKTELFLEIGGVCQARRLVRYREGEREETKSVRLTFEGNVLPERVYVDYLCYRVRPFERAPLRCFKCQEYGHVAAVCVGSRRCGRCGKDNCEETCKEQEERARCLHCGGEHYAGATQCPRKVKEVKLKKIREETRGMSYAEAVQRVEGSTRVESKPEQENTVEKAANANIIMDKRHFLPFIAMVINCAADIKTKSERIKMVLEAARRFLNVEDVSGEELDNTLREGVSSTQTSGSG